MKKTNPRRCHSAQSTQHDPAGARREPAVRLTQSVNAPNSNLPFTAACLADRQLAAVYAEHSKSILPKALRQMRKARRLKQYVVALCAGISRDMLWRVETGRSVPTYFLLSKIVFSIGVTWSQLASVLDKMLARKMSKISDDHLRPACVEMPPDENGMHQHS